MRRSLHFRSAATLLVAVALGLAIPGNADAADPAASSAPTAAWCTTGYVQALEDVRVRTGPHLNSTVVLTVPKGTVASCDGTVGGDGYHACDLDSNAWIKVHTANWRGYSAVTCWKDI
jgi:uncharacterized protein YraI